MDRLLPHQRVAVTPIVGRAWSAPKRDAPENDGFVSAITRALTTQLQVLATSAVAVAIGGVFARCFAAGNVATGDSPSHQSVEMFAMATTLWFLGLFTLIIVTGFALRLLPEQFATKKKSTCLMSSSRVLKLGRIILKLVVRLAVPISLLSVAAVVVAIQTASTKVAVYFNTLCTYYITVLGELHTRQIFKTETTRGQAALARKLRRSQFNSRLMTASKLVRAIAAVPFRKRFMKVALEILPLYGPILGALAYAHVTVILLSTINQWYLVLYMAVSVLLKLSVQGVVKRGLIQHRSTPSKFTMLNFLATPTVVIEIQLRIVLLQLNSNALSAAGLATLGVYEIVVRTGKVLLMRRHLQCKAVVLAPSTKTEVESRRGPAVVDNTLADLRRRKLMLVHTAEILANMYADYLAIGCSYTVVAVFGEHPHSQFHARSGMIRSRYARLVALQLGMAVAVDAVACMVEIGLGLRWRAGDQRAWHVLDHMVGLVFLNVALCAGLYLNR